MNAPTDASRLAAAEPDARTRTAPGAASLRSSGAWAAFERRHLFDYNPVASRVWALLVLIGGAALLHSIGELAHLSGSDVPAMAAWALLVCLAAAFPIRMPRSGLSLAVGDVLMFLLLALHGPAVATIAAALEGAVGSMRSSKRLSSRLASPASGALAMSLAGLAFVLLQPVLRHAGLPFAAAEFAALLIAALVYFPAHTLPMMQVLSLKRGSRLGLTEWFAQASPAGALYLVSAIVAGVLSLNARQFGPSLLVVAVAAIGLVLFMLRSHFQHQALEHAAQEARVATAERASRQNQKRFHASFRRAAIGMAIVAADGTVLQANQALCALLGRTDADLLLKPFRNVLHPSDATLLDRRIGGLLTRRDDGISIELRCIGSGAREIWVSLHCAIFDDADALAPGDSSPATDDSAGLIFQLHDISSRRRAERELLHIAYHDTLTDLANRDCFQERLRVAVERSRGPERFSFALIYLDLDRFKVVNDSLGHAAGDELLREVGRRLAAHTRPIDLVARVGGDEFAILLESPRSEAEVVRLGERLLGALDQSVHLCGIEVRPLASIGITFSTSGDREPDELLRDADLAMYQAKADGKARLALFAPGQQDQPEHRLQLEADLRRAIREGQLSLAYQPLFDLEPQRLCGFEALARWVHPTRGTISPALFIALAEETGCIEALTVWAIDEATRQLTAWRRALPQCEGLVMHVNVSGKDLSRPHFVPRVRELLQRHGLPAACLTLEITESTLMEQRELALVALSELRELGVKLGIDDFGTGYSSLSYLSTLPFDCLKIDRSFVMGMDQSPQNLEIVRTVVSLGRSLNKHVVAEGIETPAQLQMLKDLGATMGQGYLLGRPLPPGQAEQLLRATGAPTT